MGLEWPSVSTDPQKDGLNYLRIDSAHDLRVEVFRDMSVFDFWNRSLNEFPDRIFKRDSIEKDEF